MKKINSIILIIWALSAATAAQDNKPLSLPKLEEIAGIEISRASAINWYQSQELLDLLPEFVSAEGSYAVKQPFQRGKFVLKNGKEIEWLANSKDSILLYTASTEQLFRLPLPSSDRAIFPIWDKDGSDAFIDATGRVVLKPVSNNGIGEFSEGLAPVMIGDKWGYLNEKGEIVIRPRWRLGGKFSGGLALGIEYISEGIDGDSYYPKYKCGYIDRSGQYVIQPALRRNCGTFSEGLARTEADFDDLSHEAPEKGWIGYLDAQSNWAIKPQFWKASDFRNGAALVENGPDEYFIDKTGKRIPDSVKDCAWRYEFKEGLAVTAAKNGEQFVINEQCETVFNLAPELKTDATSSIGKDYNSFNKDAGSAYFSEGLLPIYKYLGSEKVFGYLDWTGRTAIGFKFVQATPFSDGLAGVVIKEKDASYSGYINHQGEIVLKHTRGIQPFHRGLAFHFLFLTTIGPRPNFRNKYGYLNKQGKYVWVSPGTAGALGEAWIRENYAGPNPPE